MKDLETIYEACRKLHLEERADYLTQACKGDNALRCAVEELLSNAVAANNYFSESDSESFSLPETLTLTDDCPIVEGPGSRIGRYKILQEIGTGGMGVVYMAEQLEPVNRKVALKIIKLGMDTRSVIARFEAEQQALAMMDHPNIARVLDAGATETGRPFFVMEIVNGVPITEFCNDNRLTLDKRLTLFRMVCDAIQHAHQKGIIHRDIKPNNVLVTLHGDQPVVKVIDFGIAKAMHGKLTEKTLFTHFNQFVGTPAYMSPEQASLSGLDIDTRSDVYSLGVLLYELITGKTPIDRKRLTNEGFDTIRRIIKEEEAPKPSTCISTMKGQERNTMAHLRRMDAKVIESNLSGDLDWITMKAIEKDRAIRYHSAEAMQADLDRYLNNEPVLARPPNLVYLSKTLFQRHKVVVTVSASIALILIISSGISTYLALELSEALEKSEREQLISRQTLRFMTQDILEAGSSQRGLSKDITLRETLDLAAASLDKNKDYNPLVESTIRKTLGKTFKSLGEFKKANEHLMKAYDIQREELTEDVAQTGSALLGLAGSYSFQGKNQMANEFADRAYKVLSENNPNDPLLIEAEIILSRSASLDQTRMGEIIARFENRLSKLDESGVNALPLKFSLMTEIGTLLAHTGQHEKSKQWSDRAYQLCQSYPDLSTPRVYWNQSDSFASFGEMDKCKTALSKGIEQIELLFDRKESGYIDLGGVAQGRLWIIEGKLDEARQFFESMRASFNKSPDYFISRYIYVKEHVDCLYLMGLYGEAHRILEEEIGVASVYSQMDPALLNQIKLDFSMSKILLGMDRELETALEIMNEIDKSSSAFHLLTIQYWYIKGMIQLSLDKMGAYEKLKADLIKNYETWDDSFIIPSLITLACLTPLQLNQQEEATLRRWMNIALNKKDNYTDQLRISFEFSLGLAHFRLAEWKKAREYLKKTSKGTLYHQSMGQLFLSMTEQAMNHPELVSKHLKKADELRKSFGHGEAQLRAPMTIKPLTYDFLRSKVDLSL